MKTAIIDRSLVGMEFREIVKKTDVSLYASALIEAGANYIELDLEALSKLPKPNGSEKYIFRLERPDELVVANALPFSYAVIPLRLSHLIGKINIPVILEIKIGDTDPIALLKVVADNIDLSSVSLIRLEGDFTMLPDEFKSLIDKFKAKYAVPLDICPTNKSLMALSAAISAYASDAGSITLSFGDTKEYASFEEFFLTLFSVYHMVITKTYLSGICKAAVLSFLISELETKNLARVLKNCRLFLDKVDVVDMDGSGTAARRRSYTKTAPKKTIAEKRLDLMKMDDEVSEEILKILKTSNIDFYTGEKEKKETVKNQKKENELSLLN